MQFHFGQTSAVLDEADEHHEQSLTSNHGDAVERGADADEERLFLFGGGKEIEAVNGDVVGGGTEGEEPKKGEGILERMSCREGQSDSRESAAKDKLHDPNPCAAGFENVHDGTPEGFYDPGQIKPASVEGDVGVRDAQAFVEDDGDRHDNHVGKAFGEIDSGNPSPGIAAGWF